MGVAMAAVALVAVPAIAVSAQGKPRPPAVAFSFDRSAAFTPASADPRLAAAFAGRGAAIESFKFTPAAAKGRPSQIRVAVRARGLAPAPGRAVEVAAAPGHQRADPGQLQPRRLGRLEALRARRRRRQGRRAPIPRSATARAPSSASATISRSSPAASRSAPNAATGASPRLSQPDNVSVDVGAAYNLSRRVAVTGGVRYRVDQDRVATLSDQRRDSQAVYVGTAFKF